MFILLSNLDEAQGIFFYKIANQRMHNVHLLYKEYHRFFKFLRLKIL